MAAITERATIEAAAALGGPKRHRKAVASSR